MWVPKHFELDGVLHIAATELTLEHGITGIAGRNGSGKSSLLQAIWYAITGFSIPEVSVGDLLLHGKLSTRVSLIDGNEKLEILRTRAKRVATIQLMLNGEDISERTASMTEAKLAEILNLNPVLAWDAHYSPQIEQKPNFVYTSDANRKAIALAMVPKHQLRQVLDALKADYKLLTTSIEDIDKKIAFHKGKLDSLRQSNERWQATLEDIRQEMAKAERLAASQDETTSIAYLESQIDAAESEYTSARLVQQHTQEVFEECDSRYRQQRTSMEQLQGDKHVTERRLAALQTPDTKGQKVCPICKQTIAGEAIAEVEKHRTEAKQSIEQIQTKLTLAISDLEATKAEHFVLKQARDDARGCATVAGEAFAKARATLEKESAVQAQIGRNFEEEEAKAQQAIEDIAQNIADINEELSTLEDERKKLSAKRDKCQFWNKAHKHDIPSRLFMSSVAIVNQELTQIVQRLSEGTLDARITSESVRSKDNIIVQIATVPNEWRGIGTASGGQRRLVAFATMLAIRKIWQPNLGLLMLDETLDHLDNVALRSCLSALHEIAVTHPVLLVSHDPNADGMNQPIEMSNHSGISRII